MNGDTVEHIKDAIEVLNQYCDIIAVRCFMRMKSKEDDVNESILSQFLKHAKVPVVSLESATRHPLQSLADCITITENWGLSDKLKINRKPKSRFDLGCLTSNRLHRLLAILSQNGCNI